MPKYSITVLNEEFSITEDHDADGPEEARKFAVGSAMDVAADQVKAGKPFFGAHVTIEQGGKPLIAFVVCAGASPLKSP